MSEATKSNNLRFRLNNVRCDWPRLFVAEQFKGAGNYRCGAVLVIPKDDPQVATIKAAIRESAEAKWTKKGEAADVLRSLGQKDELCLHDGDLKLNAPDAYQGAYYLSANCQGADTEEAAAKPVVYDGARNVIESQGKSPIYRGCYVNAIVEIYADARHGVGVHCTLAGIQFHGHGEGFGGGAKARADEFEKVDASAGVSADDFV